MPNPTPEAGDIETKPAPAPLDRIQSLVNTLDIEAGEDRLASADAARPWLERQGFLGADADLPTADLAFLRTVRESLRAVLAYNAGGPAPTPDDWAALREAATGGSVRIVVDEHGDVQLAAAGDSLRDRLVDLLLIMRDAQRAGTWSRLKICANDKCRWAFYDRSRNRGGAWCTMAVCGNRLKNRDFRARRRGS
jgi:predicted RNA-binding Zn ribbon-like protein